MADGFLVDKVKKAKTLETKLRSAIRLIWSRSKERKEVLNNTIRTRVGKDEFYTCPICEQSWPFPAMFDVDHIEPIGSLISWRDTVTFIEKMFYGPQRAICKLCHKTKTKQDMRNIRAKRKLS